MEQQGQVSAPIGDVAVVDSSQICYATLLDPVFRIWPTSHYLAPISCDVICWRTKDPLYLLWWVLWGNRWLDNIASRFWGGVFPHLIKQYSPFPYALLFFPVISLVIQSHFVELVNGKSLPGVLLILSGCWFVTACKTFNSYTDVFVSLKQITTYLRWL